MNVLGVDADGNKEVELLWYSGIYGFGRYRIETTFFDRVRQLLTRTRLVNHEENTSAAPTAEVAPENTEQILSLERLRDQKKFDGPEELTAQIQRDVEQAKEILARA